MLTCPFCGRQTTEPGSHQIGGWFRCDSCKGKFQYLGNGQTNTSVNVPTQIPSPGTSTRDEGNPSFWIVLAWTMNSAAGTMAYDAGASGDRNRTLVVFFLAALAFGLACYLAAWKNIWAQVNGCIIAVLNIASVLWLFLGHH